MKNKKSTKRKEDNGNEADIEDMDDQLKEEENNNLNIDTINRIVYHLPEDEKMRLIDLNTIFYEEIIRNYTYEFTHEWIDYNTEGIYDIKGLLNRYSSNITCINIPNQKDIDSYNFIVELCNNITVLKVEEGDVNYLLCLAYSKWSNNIRCINIGAHFDREPGFLQQIPKFPKLETLILQRIKVNSQHLNEILFFVPEIIKTLHLTGLDCLDNNVVITIMNKFPKLKDLNLDSDKCNESVLSTLNNNFNNIQELCIGEIMQLTKASSKLKILANNISKMKVLKIYGRDDLQDEENRLQLLLSDTGYNLTSIYFVNMNMNVDYKFTTQKFPHLSELYLDCCSNITIENFRVIMLNLNLKLLSLDGSNITDDHFKAALYQNEAQFKSNLETLSLSQNFPLGHHLIQFILYYMHNLEILDVSYCKASKFNLLDTFATQVISENRRLKIKQMKVKGSFINGIVLDMMVKFSPNLEMLQVDDQHQMAKYLKTKGLLKEELIICNDSD